jgi:large subunit ribosomal protein L25
MSEDFQFNAVARNDLGKGASRRLRRLADQVPAIIYGGKKDPVSVSLSHKDLVKQLENEAFYTHVISLSVDGVAEDVILKAVQRHPAKPQVLHADFLRIDKSTKVHTIVPLHFVNEATSKGVKVQGGKVVHNLTQIEVVCFPHQLPAFIEVNVAALEAGSSLHISDLQLPGGVVSSDLLKGADHDLAVVTIVKAKAAADSVEA